MKLDRSNIETALRPVLTKNVTKGGKRLGRPPKYLSGALFGTPMMPPKSQRGRPRGDGLTTADIILAVLSKRPGFLRDFARENAPPRNVEPVSVKRSLHRKQQAMRALTGIDGPVARKTKPRKLND